MTCASTTPWPCGSPIAGGSHALGSILCARHLAAVLAPLKPPCLDRVALRRHHHASTSRETVPGTSQDRPLDPELIAAIVALAPLGATLYAARPWYPWYPRSDARMPAGEAGARHRTATPDDATMPANARSTARRAIAAGWATRITIVDDLIAEHVMVKAERNGELLAFTWANGAFVRAWCRSTLQPLGLRAAQAML